MAVLERIDDADEFLGDFPRITLSEDGKLHPSQVTLLTDVLKKILAKLNGRISHGTGQHGHRGNLDEQFVEVLLPATPGDTLTVPVNLGRIPIGFDVTWKDDAGHIYTRNRSEWTATQIGVASDVADISALLRVY